MKLHALPQDRYWRVLLLTDTIAGSVGTILRAYHDERGWHGEDAGGQQFALCAAHLRNPKLCRV